MWQVMPTFSDLDALNLWLEEQCKALWAETAHGGLPGSVADVWEVEKSSLIRLGKQVATAALTLVFEKHCAGKVSSPGSYLRGMMEKAGAGELHLERSFYGKLSGQAA
ncbi:transposase (plasmid) [Phaeobacter piscinae]|uniref:Transposase n=1 Tax=Phaeobacter piscinae TaxID=1580596 RepID=A0ABN5DKG8_9RHOB|nr:transposase [Phaeobacter piscinae]AUQ88382.1 transposase [Phaeobacter piscinae]AUR26265.1 transposase [Phaeobacter piscinae]